jgi:hypothetical protein
VNRIKVTTGVVCVLAAGLLLRPTDAYAQRYGGRVPVRSVVVVGGGFYSPWFYDPWWYGYPYWGYPPYGYGAPYDRYASLRLQVEPRQTEVFVDGYYAGVVDDFDGLFQRLHVTPGEHELEFYLNGYRSVRQKVYVQPGATFRVRHTMVPLQPGDTPDVRPAAPASAPPRPGTPYPYAPPPPFAPPPPPERGSSRASEFGTLAVRVQPGDAEVYVDGERWEVSGSDQRLLVQVSVGEHRVEIRKEGFEPFASTVVVRPGETAPLNVSLSRR